MLLGGLVFIASDSADSEVWLGNEHTAGPGPRIPWVWGTFGSSLVGFGLGDPVAIWELYLIDLRICTEISRHITCKKGLQVKH